MPVVLSQIFLWLSTSYTRKRVRINDATDLLTFDVSWCFIIASPGEERAKKWALCPFERQKTPAVSRCGRSLRRWTNGRFLHPGAPATFVDKVDWIMLGVRSLACTCLFMPKLFSFLRLVFRAWVKMQNIHFYKRFVNTIVSWYLKSFFSFACFSPRALANI